MKIKDPGIRKLNQIQHSKCFLYHIEDKLVNGIPLSVKEHNRLFSGEFSEDQIAFALVCFTPEEIHHSEKGVEEIFKASTDYKEHFLWLPSIEEEIFLYFRKNPQKLYEISPRQFEEFVAAVFRNQGFYVELTPETRDGGFDLLAVENSRLTGENVIIVECKKYRQDKRVGVGVIQRLLGVVHSLPATKGIVVTTSFFTRDAVKVAENSKHYLTLHDYQCILSWLDHLGQLPK